MRWKSDIPLTEGQLMSKRDEFWDTAPAFEGKTEIWVALKAAVEAASKDPGHTGWFRSVSPWRFNGGMP